VFHEVDETEAIATVHAALETGINYFDVAPAYGGTRSETVLGKALKGIDRSSYVLSTKVGKYIDNNGQDKLDYSRKQIRLSIKESGKRLGVDYFDIIYIHDIEYHDRRYTELALSEGLDAVQELKNEGRIGSVGFGIYPIDLWKRILSTLPIDLALVHNHYCLNDNRILELLPIAREQGIGIINAAPYASGLLTNRGPSDWHPAGTEERAIFKKASDFCISQGFSISELAFQFSSQNPSIPTTMFSTADHRLLNQSLEWFEKPVDMGLVDQVRNILHPVKNKDWF
jgi:aryl-alcohol dehydrogenase-like predicted oxidoreductase|tara:strand:+ start:5707 stop:6561 length:855 start_codon:yes stop_codon:yes gene_type:complete